jgi:hypothetical protein
MIARALGALAGWIVRALGHDLRAGGRVLASTPVMLLGLFSFGRFTWEGRQDRAGWCAAIAAAALAFWLCRWFGNSRVLHGVKLWAASAGLLVSVVLFLQYAVDTAGKLARDAFIDHGEYGALAVLAVIYVACKISLREMES